MVWTSIANQTWTASILKKEIRSFALPKTLIYASFLTELPSGDGLGIDHCHMHVARVEYPILSTATESDIGVQPNKKKSTSFPPINRVYVNLPR